MRRSVEVNDINDIWSGKDITVLESCGSPLKNISLSISTKQGSVTRQRSNSESQNFEGFLIAALRSEFPQNVPVLVEHVPILGVSR